MNNYSQIYLDSHATTPVDQDILEAMIPFFTHHYGNGQHKLGWQSDQAIEHARFQVSQLIGSRPSEMIFTSGATEAINLALLGIAASNKSKKRQIITQRTEHAAVLQCMDELSKKGYQIRFVDIDNFGRIKLDKLELLISDQTLMVAIMLANNEIGTVQPILEIGNICKSNNCFFFCDITQGLGWHEINVDKMNIDLAAMSAHKIYGPRGVGALYLRRKNKKINLSPLMYGGGQERKIRPGTLNLPGIAGFGKACELYIKNGDEIKKHLLFLRNRLLDMLLSKIVGITLNGCPNHRHPGNLNMAIAGITGEDLLGALPEIVFSVGSACHGGSAESSHVIKAITKDMATRRNSFRFGISKNNTLDEIHYVGQRIIDYVRYLRMKRSAKKKDIEVHVT